MPDKAGQNTFGGQVATVHTTTGAADLQLYTGSGRLCQVQVVTGGITFCRYYDSSTTSGAATAVQIYCFARTTTGSLGQTVDVQAPFTNGLMVALVADGPGCVVTYNKNSPNCR